MTELYIQSIKCEGDGRKNWTEPVLNKKLFLGRTVIFWPLLLLVCPHICH